MPLILGTNSIKDTSFNVDRSLRFNSGSSDSITRTNGSTTNRRTFTVSFWLKKTSITTEQHPIFAGDLGGSHPYFDFRFDDTQIINWYGSNNGNEEFNLKTNRVFRDPNAWYHFVLAIDTTQGTDTNRIKLYVNGVQETSFSKSNYPSQNFDTPFNVSGYEVQWGAIRNNSPTLNGYLAEMVLIDGQQLDPTSFGEFDSDSGIWKPKGVSGLTFGNNGFYLETKQSGTSQNSSGLGADTSGNDNHFAVNNLTALDQSTDTCTNNFATLNPLTNEDTDITISEGNLNYANSGSGDETIFASIGVSSGKWYFETKWIDTSNYMDIGVGSADEGDIGSPRADAEGTGYYMIQLRTASPGTRPFDNGSAGSGLGNSSANDINMFAIDMDNNKFYAGKNGTWYSSGDPANNSNPLITMDDGYTTLIPIVCGKSDSAVSVNFGSPSYAISSGNTDGNGYGNFEYAVPSGYYALNTKNLAEYG